MVVQLKIVWKSMKHEKIFSGFLDEWKVQKNNFKQKIFVTLYMSLI